MSDLPEHVSFNCAGKPVGLFHHADAKPSGIIERNAVPLPSRTAINWWAKEEWPTEPKPEGLLLVGTRDGGWIEFPWDKEACEYKGYWEWCEANPPKSRPRRSFIARVRDFIRSTARRNDA